MPSELMLTMGQFAGISNSFVASLWALDYGLTMAYSNFTGANIHVGGQSTFYNVSCLLSTYKQLI